MSKRKLLLADDSMTIQKVVNLTFADEGIEVFTVGNGSLAIEKLSEIEPDLVLADVHMPGLTGYEVCEQIKMNPRFQHVPVVLLVGSFEPFDEKEAERVGANDYLTKPFQSIRQLIQKVTALLANHPTEGNEVVKSEMPVVITNDSEESQMVSHVNFQQDSQEGLHKNASSETPLAGHNVFTSPSQEMSFGDNTFDDEMIETNAGQNFGSNFANSFSSSQFDAQDPGSIQSPSSTQQQISNEDWVSKESLSFDSTPLEMRPTEPLSYNDIQEMNSSMMTPTPEPEKQTDWEIFEFETNVPSEPATSAEVAQNLSSGYQAPTSPNGKSSDEIDLEFDSPVPGQKPEERFFETSSFEFINVEETHSVENRVEGSSNIGVSTATEAAAAAINDNEPMELDLDEMNLLQIDDEDSILDLQTEEATDISIMDLEVLPTQNEIAKSNFTQSPNNALSQVAGQAVSDLNMDFPPQVIEAIARLVVEKLSDKVIEKIAWEIVPDRFDLIVREQIDNRNR